MKQKNSALVLVSQGNVRGVIQVRKAALEQNPELLERMRAEALKLYNQSIIIEENLEEVDVTKLQRWLDDMNPKLDPEDGGDMPWEDAAKYAISGMLDSLEWLKEKGSVVVTKEDDGPMGPSRVECTSLKQLIYELDEAGENAWSGEVPVDGGGQVFEMSSTIDVHEMLFERCEERLKDLGWT